MFQPVMTALQHFPRITKSRKIVQLLSTGFYPGIFLSRKSYPIFENIPQITGIACDRSPRRKLIEGTLVVQDTLVQFLDPSSGKTFIRLIGGSCFESIERRCGFPFAGFGGNRWRNRPHRLVLTGKGETRHEKNARRKCRYRYIFHGRILQLQSGTLCSRSSQHEPFPWGMPINERRKTSRLSSRRGENQAASSGGKSEKTALLIKPHHTPVMKPTIPGFVS